MFDVKKDVHAIKWMDSTPITVLLSQNTTVVNRKNKDGSSSVVCCPQVIAQYNKVMGGVDRFDQLVSYIIMKLKKRNYQDQLHFRLRLTRQLIAGYFSRKRRGITV